MAENDGEVEAAAPTDGPAADTLGDALRASANTPQVHAAAIHAAKDFLLTRPELAGMTSDTAVAVIAMHAAVIFRTYLDIVGNDGLVPDIARG
jgi:hypothetical protein